MPTHTRFHSLLTALAKEKALIESQLAKVSDAIAALGGVGKEYQRRQRIRKVTVIGGALFPRTALVLGPLLPQARFTIVDRAAAHVAGARRQIAAAGLAERVSFEIGSFDAGQPQDCDLLVLPLAFRGDRAGLYRHPPAPLVAIHDWGWHAPAAARGARVPLLPKRINLVTGPAA